MTEMLITNARLILDGGISIGHVVVREGIIAHVLAEDEAPVGLSGKETIDVKGSYLAPGLIDIHIHGSHGIDVLDASAVDLQSLADRLLEEGITGYFPTLVPVDSGAYTRTLSSIDKCIVASTKEGLRYSQVLGVHFEGPFVSTKKCGALHKALFRTYDGDPSSLDVFIAQAGNSFSEEAVAPRRLMTIAPEIKGGIELIRDLTRAGVRCFIGHTVADIDTLDNAFEAGAHHITHFPNALEPLHHRRPGTVAWGLLRDDVSLDCIADYQHVHPKVLELIYKNKGPQRMALISDAIPPTGLAEGEYDVWGDRVEIKNGRTRLVASGATAAGNAVTAGGEGTIAGSVITMLDAVKNIVALGIPIHSAFHMASFVPARAAGLERYIGSISQGKIANLVAYDDELNTRVAIVEGRVKFNRL
jgi:N-acetylglucosamine-6-phosphate deacetylase